MRVAVVCPYDLGRFGGVQNQVLELAQWLGEEGHDAVVVGPGTHGPQGAVLVGPTRVIRANGSDVPLSLDPGVVRRVASAVHGSDVVHVHEPLMPLVSLAAMMRSRAPIVATFHAAPTRAARGLYRTARRTVSSVLRRAAVVTAVSPVAAHAVSEVARVRLIPNAVDVSSYPDVPRRTQQVVFVGRDEPRKGLAVLLEAWPEVRAAVPAAELVVVGSDARGSVRDGVRFVGRVSDEEKRCIVARSGIACTPNLGGESFGIVVAEAMAAGCAVVASALPGFVHAAGDAALLVKPGDVAALSWGLRRLLGNAAAADELRDRARKRAATFDRPAVLAAYITAYEDARTA